MGSAHVLLLLCLGGYSWCRVINDMATNIAAEGRSPPCDRPPETVHNVSLNGSWDCDPTQLSRLQFLLGKKHLCPDCWSWCQSDETCCRMKDGTWGCCPVPQGVCCSDHIHCCPEHYHCDPCHGGCRQQCEHEDDCPDTLVEWAEHSPAQHLSANNPIFRSPNAHQITSSDSNAQVDDTRSSHYANSTACPGGHVSCQDGQTCCEMTDSKWGCCPFPNAVCCPDKSHCCPEYYTCDPETKSCLTR